jgi:hypothetical protein
MLVTKAKLSLTIENTYLRGLEAHIYNPIIVADDKNTDKTH